MKLPIWLWPIRTGKTFFDRWTLVHLAFWYVVGANLSSQKVSWWVSFGIMIVGAYLWEAFEQEILEPRGKVKFPEGKLNRWVSDPLMAVVGGGLGWWITNGY